MHIIHKKSWLDKKKDFLQKHRICLEKKKMREKVPFPEKRFQVTKNRIYLRKKDDNKNRKQKYFFPPKLTAVQSNSSSPCSLRQDQKITAIETWWESSGDEPEPSWLKPGLELNNFQLSSARLVTFPSSSGISLLRLKNYKGKSRNPGTKFYLAD